MRKNTSPWPVLKHYDRNHLAKIAMPLGGIGTGTVSLGGRGNLRDWEIMNRPAKGFIPVYGEYCNLVAPFFALFAKASGSEPVTRILEGPLDLNEYEGAFGSMAPNHGLPRFRNCSFDAAYPLAGVNLSDPDVPLEVRIEAFNPLVPGDADRSGIPAAVLRFVLRNKTGKKVEASVCGSIPNFIGVRCEEGWCNLPRLAGEGDNVNEYRDEPGLNGILFKAQKLPRNDEGWGTMALAATSPGKISRRSAWKVMKWGHGLDDFWKDFSADGMVETPDQAHPVSPMGSLAVKTTIPARSEISVTFILAWHFPNRMTWSPKPEDNTGACGCGQSCNCIGNYYTTKFLDAWDALRHMAENAKSLEEETVSFVRAICETDVPLAVREAALFNLTSLRSQTCFRTPDGRLFAWEGCADKVGCCPGSCTHVWNYEQATAFLFGDLAFTMREVEFLHALDEKGLMSFRVNLPIEHARENGIAAADGQMGSVMKAYRDWRLSGDMEMLHRLWPGIRKSVEFCWVKGGWDADQDGVMEGCQHNTLDVEYFGPNPLMQGWYLGALSAAATMAEARGEKDFAERCRALLNRGREWTDANLWNGEYYEQHIRPIEKDEDIYPGLKIGMGAQDVRNPDFQLGPGCLIDQLAGQYMAHVNGLGYLLDRNHVRKTLASVLKYNFKKSFHDVVNVYRSFAIGSESAIMMVTYPKGRKPEVAVPYNTEVMTGFEHTVAAHLAYEGMFNKSRMCIQAIRDRYDGRKRNPFNEAECGNHYGRAMASWASLLAWTGFQYSAIDGAMSFRFTGKDSTFFWSSGRAWGTFRQRPGKKGLAAVELTVKGGELRMDKLSLEGFEPLAIAKALSAGRTLSGSVRPAARS